MKKLIGVLIATLLISVLPGSKCIAQDHHNPKLKDYVKIDDDGISVSRLPDGRIKVSVTVTPLESVDAYYVSNIAKRARTHGKRQVRLSKGVKHEIVEYVDQYTDSAILFDFKVYVEGAEIGYAREYSKIFKVNPGKDRLEVLTIAYLSEGEAKVIGEDIQILFGDNVARNKGVDHQIMANYSVNISGKVEYFEPSVPSLSSGLYGGEVVLWFRDSANPGTWYHPVVGNSEHTHYDELSEDGSFSFSFNFTGDLTGYDEAIVLVNTGNSAAFMPAPMDGYISYGGGGVHGIFQ